MNDIFGLFSESLSPSWRLQLSLASRLRHRLAASGSPLYEVTWRRWDMPSGPPIYRLRLSVRPICVTVSGGVLCVWPTLRTSDGNGAGVHGEGGLVLRATVLWATPVANDAKGSRYRGNSNRIVLKLPGQVQWATPTARDWKDGARLGSVPVNGLLGRQVLTGYSAPIGGSAPTKSFGRLNPAFSLWLMGFPAEWLQYVPREMRSFRRSGRFS